MDDLQSNTENKIILVKVGQLHVEEGRAVVAIEDDHHIAANLGRRRLRRRQVGKIKGADIEHIVRARPGIKVGHGISVILGVGT